MLRGEKIITRSSIKYAKLSIKLFYYHYQGEFINKYSQYISLIMRKTFNYILLLTRYLNINQKWLKLLKSWPTENEFLLLARLNRIWLYSKFSHYSRTNRQSGNVPRKKEKKCKPYSNQSNMKKNILYTWELVLNFKTHYTRKNIFLLI